MEFDQGPWCRPIFVGLLFYGHNKKDPQCVEIATSLPSNTAAGTELEAEQKSWVKYPKPDVKLRA